MQAETQYRGRDEFRPEYERNKRSEQSENKYGGKCIAAEADRVHPILIFEKSRRAPEHECRYHKCNSRAGDYIFHKTHEFFHHFTSHLFYVFILPYFRMIFNRKNGIKKFFDIFLQIAVTFSIHAVLTFVNTKNGGLIL